MTVFLFIVLATIVEAAGDAVIRLSLHAHSTPARIALFLGGAALLAIYGTSLNLAPVEFGTVTGVYVAMVFICFQISNYVFFRTAPTPPILIGGSLIIAGSAIIYFWR